MIFIFFLLILIYKINDLIKSEYYKINVFFRYFLSFFYTLLIFKIQQLSNFIKIILFNNLIIYLNP